MAIFLRLANLDLFSDAIQGMRQKLASGHIIITSITSLWGLGSPVLKVVNPSALTKASAHARKIDIGSGINIRQNVVAQKPTKVKTSS
ncbi:unnamed protein product [Clavelina lepadiformis]|uniref:Uncharacterized protein n=1 Tax=Clavelina lepadiformis TaxID=159417 RepID=A0ABP0FRW5_CLALP